MASCLALVRPFEGGPLEYIAHEFVLTSSAVSRVSCSTNLDGFGDGKLELYSFCFVKCCFYDLFNKARSILVQLLSSFFSINLVSVNVVHPYSSMDTVAPWKKTAFYFIR